MFLNISECCVFPSVGPLTKPQSPKPQSLNSRVWRNSCDAAVTRAARNDTPPLVVSAEAAHAALLADRPNAIYIGSPRGNVLTAELAVYWRSIGHAASWSDEGVLSLGGCAYPDSGALVLGPRPGGGLALVLSGASEQRLREALSLGDPTIPPMARSPFSNVVPDFVVLGPAFGATGWGGVLAAGSFDNHWRLEANTTLWYSAACD